MRRAALLALVLVAGCGFGPGDEQEGGAELRITRDFGREELAADEFATIREDATVMRLLQSGHDVETRFGGNFVQEIDGLAGSQSEMRDWFYWVNGQEADKGATEWEVHPGDVIQWDNRKWIAGQRIPAIVGAFPEPFRSGTDGDRLPVRVECADTGAGVCSDVKDALARAGARVSTAQIGASGGTELIRVLVGRWEQVRDVRTAALLEEGPETSGVFAQFADGGERLELLDERGEVARDAPVGSGIVAALAPEDQGIVWIVSGPDDVGVEAAAAALDERSLRNAFAVAATPEGPLKLPVANGE